MALIEKSDIPDTVYHYCGVSSFYGILTSKQLWLNNVHFMNDYAEQLGFIEKAKKRLNELLQGSERQEIQFLMDHLAEARLTPYVCCFSREGDLLSQWRAYADDGAGFAVGFSSSWLSKKRGKCPLVLWKAVYNEDRQLELLNTSIQKYLDHMKQQDIKNINADAVIRDHLAIWIISAACKNHGFREEKEWRLIISMPFNLENTNWECLNEAGISKMCFRVSNERVIPYLTFPFPEHVITTIYLGPKNYARDDDSNLKIFLAENGYNVNHIKIERSESTYR